MNDWEKQQAKLVADNTNLAKELLPLINGISIEKPYERGFSINLGDGRGIHVLTDDLSSTKPYYKISCIWPKFQELGYQSFYPTSDNCTNFVIKVAKSRGMTAVAKDIEKRLLPQYFKEFEIQMARGNQTLADKNNRNKVVTEISSMLGVKPSAHELETGSTGHTKGIFNINVSENGETVKIDTYYLPTEKAKKVIETIIGLKES